MKRLLRIMLGALCFAPCARAGEVVAYRAYDAETRTFTSATADDCTSVTKDTETLADGWYVVADEVTCEKTITVSGTVNLILADGAKLTANDGICVEGENMLNIYAQDEGTGQLFARTASEHRAGIGSKGRGNGSLETGACGAITINGGNVTAQGGEGAAAIGGGMYHGGGTVTINGGQVTATGIGGAGIGCGRNGRDGAVTINGGTVTAQGGEGAAGIGSGNWGESIAVTVNGGIVEATGGLSGAGIGGDCRKSVIVTINGGDVKAKGGNFGDDSGGGPGIGGGYQKGAVLTINGGTVTATGGEGGEGEEEFENPFDPGNVITISHSFDGGAGIGGEGGVDDDEGGAGGTVTINGGNVKASSIQVQPVNGAGNSVYPVETALPAVTDASQPVDVSDLTGYGTKDVHPLDGNMLYFYLPDGHYGFTAAGTFYGATVEGGPSAAEVSWKVTVGQLLRMTAVWTSGTGSKSNTVENGSFTVPAGAENVTVIFTPDEGFELEGDDVVKLESPITGHVVFGEESGYRVPKAVPVDRDVPYLGWDAANGQLSEMTLPASSYTFVDETTTTFENGKWYVVAADVAIDGGLAVEGSACLILMDGASLTIDNAADNSRAIDILTDGSLTICAQAGGTGWLSATGNGTGAGIGGAALTINGGSIIALGGETVEGIDCTAVTINGGNVMASPIAVQPKNGAGAEVRLVTVDVAGLGNDGLKIEGLAGYGIGAVMPIAGKLYLYLPEGGYEFSVDGTDYVAEVAGEETVEAARYRTLPEDTACETFEDGLHFVESLGGAYINTRYHPTPNARFEVNQQTVDATISMAGSVCVFCGTGEGGRLQPQTMRLYSFKIYDTVDDKADQLVHDYVPFRTTDGPKIVGLYDKVTHALCINQGNGSLVLGCGGKKAVANNWFTEIAEDAWADLGISNVSIHEPCDEGGTICSRIEIDTTEDLFLRKFCDFEPDPEFVDVSPYLPCDALAAVKVDSDLLWTEDTVERLRKYLPELADLLDELESNGLRGDVVGGMYACVVPDDEVRTTGMGMTFGIGVKGVATWNHMTNLMDKAGEIYINEGSTSVGLKPNGVIWGFMGGGHEPQLDLVQRDGKFLICGYSSKTVRNRCQEALEKGQALELNPDFQNRSGPLFTDRNESRQLRGFAYVTPDFVTKVGNASDGLLKLLLNCCGLTDCWNCSIIETTEDRIFVTSRMSQSVSDFYELALWLGTDFAGNIVPEIGETVKFDRDYGPSGSAKGHFDFILGLLRIGRTALGITGLDYRYQDETPAGRAGAGIDDAVEYGYAASMLSVKTKSDSSTLFKMIAAGEAGSSEDEANASERYLPATALAAVALQPTLENCRDIGDYFIEMAGRKDIIRNMDIACPPASDGHTCSMAFFGERESLLVYRIGTKSSFRDLVEPLGGIWELEENAGGDEDLLVYNRIEGNAAQKNMRLAFHDKEGMIIYATSQNVLEQALAAGLRGQNRLCASDAFKQAMGTTLPAHNTLMYCAKGCVRECTQWVADHLSGFLSGELIAQIMGRSVLDLNACGYGVRDGDVYRHYTRMRKKSHDALMAIALAAFDAAGEGLQRVCPYDGSDLHNFDSGFLRHSIDKANENGCVTDHLMWPKAVSGWTFVDNREGGETDWQSMDPRRPQTLADGRTLVLSCGSVFSRRADADGGSGDLSIAFDIATSGQTCEGGKLEHNEANDLWVLVPNAGRDTVMLGGLPDRNKLVVRIGDYDIPGGAFNGFRNDNSSVYSLALNPDGVVNGTPVRPVVGSFAVDANGATLRFMTIRGLYYELVRAVGGFNMGQIENGIGLIGDGKEHSLQDDKKIDDPRGGVFYSLRVSLPGVQSDSTTQE